MNQQARAPNPPPPNREAGLHHALLGLSHAIAELVRLSSEDRTLPAAHLDLLRTRRSQLSRIIDDLGRFTGRLGETRPTTTTRRPPPP